MIRPTWDEQFRETEAERNARLRTKRLSQGKDSTMASPGTDLPKEMARVRDVLMPQYLAVGPAGGFALAMMRAELDRATKVLTDGDIVTMLRSYEALKGFKE